MGHVAVFLTPMRIGGTQRVARNVCAGLVENGHAVDLVLVNAEGDLLADLPPPPRSRPSGSTPRG